MRIREEAMNIHIPRTAILVSSTIGILALVAAGFTVQSVGARSNVGAPVRASATGHTVTVTGHGTANVTPDMATLTLGVQTKGSDAQAALKDNANKMTAVIASVKANGVSANHIQTSDLSIWFDDQHGQYIVSHSVSVRVDNVNSVGTVLDSAVGAGANTSWGVQFGVKDTSAAQSQALQNAVSDARKHADAIASGLGVTVSGVGSASEVSYSNPIVYAPRASAAPAVSTPVQPGELSITADVQVVYTFA
jgi:uncharacterized protein YggE